jgi:hypothetical protein
VALRQGLTCGLALAALIGTAQARDLLIGSDTQYPYSIMAPEPGTVPTAHRLGSHWPQGRGRHGQAAAHLARPRHRMVARGSSGSVLPTPLPRTELIPPEGGAAASPSSRAAPQEHGPTVLPGGAVVPNLPHGTETFQDRASRCAFQQGLYGVPSTGAGASYASTCGM